MIRLNIIPESTKKDIKTELIFKSIKKLIIVLFVALLVYSSILFSTKLYIQHELDIIINTTEIDNNSTNDYKKKIDTYNQEIKNINLIYKDYVTWSNLIEYFSKNINSNITINKLSLNKKNNQILFFGLASDREDLLSFKEMLDNSGFLSETKVPIDNLLEKENINFNITSNIISYEFTKF
jgi:hypothetical protein